MKNLLYLFLLLPIFLAAQPTRSQQDSVVYQKIAGLWYKTTYVKQGTRKVIITDEYTDKDTLVYNALKNDVTEAAYQYQLWKEKTEQEEEGYLLRIRQAEKVYKELTGKRVDVDTFSNAKQLLGTWLYDGEQVVITKQLKIKTFAVNFVSEKVFWMNIGDKKEFFFKKENDWYSDNHRLIQVKKLNNK